MGIVDIEGVLDRSPGEVTGCTQTQLELVVDKVFIVCDSEPKLPVQIEDCSLPEGAPGAVSRDIRLNTRVLDLRTPQNQAIFQMQAGVCRLFREFLTSQGFTEIHSPKIIN